VVGVRDALLVLGSEKAVGALAGDLVVDALASLGLEHLRHHMHHGAVGVELLRRVAAVVGEAADQVFVGIAQRVLGHIGHDPRNDRSPSPE
jgi:hypothetical protein